MHPTARSILDYALVRGTVLMNQNVIYRTQVDEENLRTLPMILSKTSNIATKGQP